MYYKVEPGQVEEPKGFTTFTINERIPRILIWINNNFIIEEDLESETRIDLALIALKTNKTLMLRMEQGGQFTILTDDMELAGNLVQSLATYLNITDLKVTCDFPEELDNLQNTLVKVNFQVFCSIFKNLFV